MMPGSLFLRALVPAQEHWKIRSPLILALVYFACFGTVAHVIPLLNVTTNGASPVGELKWVIRDSGTCSSDICLVGLLVLPTVLSSQSREI